MKTIRNSHARPLAALFTLFALALPVSIAAANAVTLISRSPTGGAALTGAGGESPTISGDGRFVAFLSSATNFGMESNGLQQVYVRDRNSGQLQTVSRSSAGELSNAQCFLPIISRNGRYVVFLSHATNLARLPDGARTGVFLRDLQTQQTELIAPWADAQTGDTAGGSELAISGDGRYVAFTSYDRSLVANDTNNAADVFVKDRSTGLIERVSLGAAGAQGNRHSGLYGLSISDDGRYVSFNSEATNLVSGDTNDCEDIFVRDRQLGTTERVSLSTSGSQLDHMSRGGVLTPDGRYVAFTTSANLGEETQIYGGVCVRDRIAGTTEIVTVDTTGALVSGGSAYRPSISRDGRYVLFENGATSLVAGDTNGVSDVFLRDRVQNTTERISVGTANEQANYYSILETAPAISDSGNVVVFTSEATNLVAGDTNGRTDVFARLRQSSTTERISVDPDGREGIRGASSGIPVVSADGQSVVFWSDATNLVPDDTNGLTDLFLYSRATGQIERINVSSAGTQSTSARGTVSVGVPAISADGRFVAFASTADDLVSGDTNRVSDLFVRDRQAGTTERVNLTAAGEQEYWGVISYGNNLAISADGRYVAFPSGSSVLVPNDTNNGIDVFVRDRLLGTNERVNLASDGTQSNAGWELQDLAMSADGRVIAFTSFASNLVPGDTNGAADVFVRDRVGSALEKVPAAHSWRPALSADGRHVLFATTDSTLTPGDTNNSSDLYLWDRTQNSTERVSLAPGGGQLAVGSFRGSMSADARYVAYSGQVEVVPELDRWQEVILLHDRQQGTVGLASITEAGGLPNGICTTPTLSGTGALLAFVSNASNLVSGDVEPNMDVFVRALGTSSLEAPGSLVVTPVSATSLRLTWDDLSTGETGFAIERLEHGVYQVIGTTTANVGQFLDSGLLPASTYSFRVRACDLSGFSPYSGTASGTTLPLAPSAPTGFTAVATAQTAVQLSWTDTSSNEQGFVLERAVGNGSLVALATAAENSSAYTDPSVTADTTYRYVLRAYNAGGQSTAVEASATTLPNAPAAPSGLTGGARNLTSVRLTWQDNSTNETGFRVERQSNMGGFTTLGTVAAGVTEYLDTAVTPGAAYQYQVVAINSGGNSAASNQLHVVLETGGKLQVSPIHLKFGVVKRGKAKRLKLTLKNQGKVAISGEVGSLTAPYRIVEGGGMFTLERGKSRKVTVEFAPTDAGLSTRQLSVTSTSAIAGEQMVEVTGRGK